MNYLHTSPAKLGLVLNAKHLQRKCVKTPLKNFLSNMLMYQLCVESSLKFLEADMQKPYFVKTLTNSTYQL